MATLHIRRLDDSVRDRLRVRAARNGRSMEAEARAMLAQATAEEPPPHDALKDLQRWVRGLYGNKPTRASLELIRERRLAARREEAEFAPRVRRRP